MAEACTVFTSAWINEEIPKEWLQSIIWPLHKKVGQLDCGNCTGTTLLNATYKVFYNFCKGAHGGAVFEALRYKPEDLGVDSRWCDWNFSLT
jgi:hypothetical protein